MIFTNVKLFFPVLLKSAAAVPLKYKNTTAVRSTMRLV